MSEPCAASFQRQARGRVHVWIPEDGGGPRGRVVPTLVTLERLEDQGAGCDRLWGRFVRVRNAGIVNRASPPTGTVSPVRLGDARADANGDFLFDPARGGARIDKYVLRSEKYQQRYVEAARFGEVNTYYHVDRIAAYVDTLLRELGARPLPPVVAVVNAHHAAVVLPDATRDGILRFERWVPFQGGHYRLPARSHGIRELEPLSPDGEIHLGPGWKLLEHGALVESAGGRYRHNASHNAGTIYHEYGHHITAHTADLRANSLRPPGRKSNLKTALDEGFCDYFAAAMLGTPHIWAWHRRHGPEEIHDRSLASGSTMADYDASDAADPHRNGTIWAAALWDLRTHMANASPGGALACDRLALQTLLLLGEEIGPTRPATIQEVRKVRASFQTALAKLLEADARHGREHAHAILELFGRRGFRPSSDVERSHLASPGGARDTDELAGESVRGRTGRGPELHSGWRANPRTLDDLSRARAQLLRHVPDEDVVETRDIFARGELGARLRQLDEPPWSVLACGDIMLGGRSESILEERGLEYPFKSLRPLLCRASIVLGNLEGPLASHARRQPRNFSYRVDPRTSLALKRAGIHVMSLANNHLLDCGRRGVLETIEALTRMGIAPLGAGTDDVSAHAPVVREAQGLRIGFLGYYWNRRTAARANLPGSAMDPPEALAADIRRLRDQVDRVVVTFHWGVPYVREPSPEDRAKARWAIECGADAVIGHHVHVIQPFEVHRDRPIFYGIGNCAFGSGNSKAEGLLVGLRFEPDRTRVQVLPLYVKNRDPRVDYQPKVLRGSAAGHYLGRLVELSGEHGSLLRLEDFRATFDLPWTRERIGTDQAPSRRAASS